jgi:hypothetical protein
MRLKPGKTIVVVGKRFVVTGQRGGYTVAVREGEVPSDVNYHAFRTDVLVRDAQAKAAKHRALVESWELAELP